MLRICVLNFYAFATPGYSGCSICVKNKVFVADSNEKIVLSRLTSLKTILVLNFQSTIFFLSKGRGFHQAEFLSFVGSAGASGAGASAFQFIDTFYHPENNQS